MKKYRPLGQPKLLHKSRIVRKCDFAINCSGVINKGDRWRKTPSGYNICEKCCKG